MAYHHHEQLRTLAKTIFEAAGVPTQDAIVVSNMLVDADLMGLSSHGIQRVPQYVDDVKQNMTKPGAGILVTQHTPTTAMVNGQWNFGQIVAKRATEQAIAMAKAQGMGSVVVRGCRHVGRLGAFTELCVADGCIGIAMASGGKEGHWVAPFGGKQGRLSTNPIAFAVPTQSDPILMDFSTASAAEGKIRLLRDSHEKLPEPWLVNTDGQNSNDPWDLYDGKSGRRAGAILPFGGSQGYKSYSFALMAQILAASLGAPIWASDGIGGHTNGMWLLAIRVDAFMETNAFCADVQAMAQHIKSSESAEGSDGVLMPGELELRTAVQRREQGVPIHDNIWKNIAATAQSLNVDVKSI